MRKLHRIVLWAVLVGVTPMIAGCANFDPDSLDIFGLNEKKKLPGERHDLFPGGVPGVTQGIPPEYLKSNEGVADPGYNVPAEPSSKAAAAESATKPAAAEPAKPKAKPKPKRVAKRPSKPTRIPDSSPQQGQTTAPAAEQQPQQQKPATTSAWPAPAQSSPSSSGSAWPAPQPSGTFQR